MTFPTTPTVVSGVTQILASWGNSVRTDLTSLRDGWIPAHAMIYGAATTLIIEGDPVAYSYYPKGTRIKITQTTSRYFVVVNSDSVGSDSVLTVTGGSDYTVANDTVVNPLYSYSNPLDFPYTFNWTPTLGGFSPDPTNAIYRFSVTGNICTVFIRRGGGTSDDTVFTISAPITAKTLTDAQWEATCRVADNSSIQTSPGYMSIASAASTINVYKTLQDGAWTASGNKRVVSAILVYEI